MPRSIAIVEDEPLIRANYVEALARLGYEVRGYASRVAVPRRARPTRAAGRRDRRARAHASRTAPASSSGSPANI